MRRPLDGWNTLWQRRHLASWLPFYVIDGLIRRWGRPLPSPLSVILAIADHYEPQNGGVDQTTALKRVERWVRDYPRLFGGFKDCDGRPPRHTFFHPIEMYAPRELDGLAELCQAGFGEVELHLHHDGDTPENLRRTLLEARDLYAHRHSQLARRPNGQLAYGFVHGNWALDNSRPDGRFCGINNELDILRETGCYGDFTLPSAPSPTQTRMLNAIYRAWDDPDRPKSHDRGERLRARRRSWDSPTPGHDRSLLIVQGPLLLDWSNRKWGVLPRLENSNLQGNQVPTGVRLDRWISARIGVQGRPDWIFVKLHTHGANPRNIDMLLGDPMVRFHEELSRRAAEDSGFRYHYVTTREMVNLISAAEAGWEGPVEPMRDHGLVWNGRGEPKPKSSLSGRSCEAAASPSSAPSSSAPFR